MAKLAANSVARYGAAIGAVVVAAALRALLDPYLGDDFPFVSFFAAVILVAYLIGFGPALVASGLGGLGAAYWFMQERYTLSISPTSQLGLAIYLCLSSLTAWLMALLSRANEQTKRAAAEVSRQREQLEREVAERKQAEGELHEAKEAAENANRTKGEFLANISHELRTPMNAIIGMTELALEEPLSPAVRDYLKTVKESADTLLGLLNEILDFSRLESGKFVLESTPFRLRSALNVSIKTLAIQAYAKGLELSCDVAQDVPDSLVGDPLRLRQVLMNLVGNAIKFTDRGEVAVTVNLEAKSSDEVVLRLSVSDTGIGISQLNQERIFAPFTQADASTTRHFGGTGLGLAISSELVRLMGGHMRLESELGRGSTFHFTVRFLRGLEPKPGEQEPSLDHLHDIPVLVVDDNATNRRILDEALRGWGMKPELVEDGQAALASIHARAADGENFPLVILDALMPGMDGFTLAAWIKGDPRLAGATILMLSSSDRQANSQRLQELGLSSYLRKPINQADLLDAVLHALNLSESLTLGEAETLAAQRRPTASRRLRILVAEDTPANQKLIVNILEKQGHQVLVAQNGRDTVELVQRESFDLVLMDVQMPLMDGLQATAAIRALPAEGQPRLPIVAMTAHAMRGDRDRCLAAGMDAYLPKPLDSRRLMEVIEGLTDHQCGDATQETAAQEPSVETPSEAVATVPICDLDAALERMGGDRRLLGAIVQFFLEDSPELVDRLQRSIRDGDAREVERAAHSLKGLASNFGAVAVVEASARLEQIGREGDLSQAAGILSRLEPDLAQLRETLEPHLAPVEG